MTKRGVYRSPWLSPSGYPELVAVDREGRRVGNVALFPRDSLEDVAAMLWRFLDREDPAEPEAVQ